MTAGAPAGKRTIGAALAMYWEEISDVYLTSWVRVCLIGFKRPLRQVDGIPSIRPFALIFFFNPK